MLKGWLHFNRLRVLGGNSPAFLQWAGSSEGVKTTIRDALFENPSNGGLYCTQCSKALRLLLPLLIMPSASSCAYRILLYRIESYRIDASYHHITSHRRAAQEERHVCVRLERQAVGRELYELAHRPPGPPPLSLLSPCVARHNHHVL